MNSNLKSNVRSIPGIGSVTEERLQEKGIHSVGDLVDQVESFADLKGLVGKVNAHRIFDCLEPYLEKKCPKEYDVKRPPTEDELNAAMERVALVDDKEDKKVAEEISRCTLM